jgi:hypothetical protein
VFPGHEMQIYDERMVIVGIESFTEGWWQSKDLGCFV